MSVRPGDRRPNYRRFAEQTLDKAAEDAKFAAKLRGRLDQAFRNLDPETALSPLRASRGGRGGGHSDPTGNTVLDDNPHPKPTLEELDAARDKLIMWMRERERIAWDMLQLLHWCAPIAPDQQSAAENDRDMWCSNHRKYGQDEPVATRYGSGNKRRRGKDGLCAFCATVLKDHGHLPNSDLLRLKDRRRLTADDIARNLSRNGSGAVTVQRRLLKPGEEW